MRGGAGQWQLVLVSCNWAAGWLVLNSPVAVAQLGGCMKHAVHYRQRMHSLSRTDMQAAAWVSQAWPAALLT